MKFKNDIQNSRLRWFGHVMWMREARIYKKMLNTKIEGKRLRERPRTRHIDQIRNEPGNCEQIQKKEKEKKTGSGRMETAGDVSVMVEPYLWKRLKNVVDIMKKDVFLMVSDVLNF